jgi:maleylacetoacetate isomerase
VGFITFRDSNMKAMVSTIRSGFVVPAMSDGQSTLTQSLAIIEYIEEVFPSKPALLPADPRERARVRALALTVACEIHPINNLRVLQYLTTELGIGDANREAWYRPWTVCGFSAPSFESRPPAWRSNHFGGRHPRSSRTQNEIARGRFGPPAFVD